MCGDCEYAKACRRCRCPERPELLYESPPPVAGMVSLGSVIPKVLADARTAQTG